MTTLTDQLSAVRQSQWEAQLDIFHTLTSRALDSASQLIDLQLRASRTSVEQVAGTFKQLLDAASPNDLVAVGSRAQGQWHYLFSYSRELFGIATGLRGETWRVGPRAVASAFTPSLTLIPALTANVPSSIPQALEQVSIATAGATSVNSEIAAAAVDTGAALAEATLQAGAEAVERSAETAQEQTHAVSEAASEAVSQAASQVVTDVADNAVQQFEQASDAGHAVIAAVADSADGAERTAEHTADDAIAAFTAEAPVADTLPVAETPLVQALHEIAPKPADAGHPVASTLALDAQDHIALPKVAPLEAEPPAHIPAPTPPKSGRPARSRK